MQTFRPIFEKLIAKDVKIFVVTRNPQEHDNDYKLQAETEIAYFEDIGVQPLLCTGNHHRKLAILDRKILWEGSLNILSQSHSREFMRRIDSKKLTEELFQFLKFDTLNL